MKNDPLFDQLRRLSAPPADPAAKTRALDRARTALGHSGEASPSPAGGAPFFGRIGFALLPACLVLLAWLGWTEHRRAEETATLRVLLGQMEATFQNRLSAVILKDGGAQVVLSGDEAEGTAKPLLLTLHDGRSTIRILTFSGRWIDLPMNGSTVRVQVMETGSGRLLLAGDRFVWDSSRRTIGGTRIEGRLL